MASAALDRLRLTRRQARLGAVVAVLVFAAVGGVYAVTALLGDVNELGTNRIVFSDDWRLNPFARERMTVELLAANGDDYVLSWAFVDRIRVDGDRVGPAPEQQLVAVWSDQALDDTIEVDSIQLLGNGKRRFVGFPRLLGSEIVVASVPHEMDVAIEVVSGDQSEVIDLRTGTQQVTSKQPSDSSERAADDGDPDSEPDGAATDSDTASSADRDEAGEADDRPVDEIEDDSPAEASPASPPEPSEEEAAAETPTDGEDERAEDDVVDQTGEGLDDDLPSFEGTAAPGSGGREFVGFLRRHDGEIVYLDVSTPYPGEYDYSSGFLLLDESMLARWCTTGSCAVSFYFDFYEGTQADVTRSGETVTIRGRFWVRDAGSINSVYLVGVRDDYYVE